jgi:hypothetical protein
MKLIYLITTSVLLLVTFIFVYYLQCISKSYASEAYSGHVIVSGKNKPSDLYKLVRGGIEIKNINTNMGVYNDDEINLLKAPKESDQIVLKCTDSRCKIINITGYTRVECDPRKCKPADANRCGYDSHQIVPTVTEKQAESKEPGSK